MHYEIIKTGSGGNCIIVEDKFMLDCGIAYKTIQHYLENIKLIFISHRHSDHLNPSTVKNIAYVYPNIKFICGDGVYEDIRKCGVRAKQLYRIPEGFWFTLGSCLVRVDYLYHDVPNYCLHLIYKGKSLFYCTDTSRVDHIKAKNYDLYLIEANYETDEELDKRILEAKEKGEFTHLERVKTTHLSQLKAINWLDENKGKDGEVAFIHQHIERGNDNVQNEEI